MKFSDLEWKKLDSSKCKELPKKAGVYILLDELGDILYVGQSMSLFRRLKPSHSFLKMASIIVYSVCNHYDRLELEKMAIRNYQPRYNINLYST